VLLKTSETLLFIFAINTRNSVTRHPLMFADDVVTASRIIRLHAIPRSVCFSSERGDMLLGIGEQLHRIEHKSCESSQLQMLLYCNSLCTGLCS